jgi:DNA-binding MarR family transcriptional regulator
MGEALKRRLKTTKFQSPQEEAILSLLVAAGYLEAKMDRECAGFGISHQQYNILRILKGVYPDGHPCGEIAARMLHPSPDVTRRLDAMEKEGLIERHRSTDDRRVVVTRITDKGIEVLNAMDVVLAHRQEELRNKFSAQECQELTRLCEKFYEDEV